MAPLRRHLLPKRNIVFGFGKDDGVANDSPTLLVSVSIHILPGLFPDGFLWVIQFPCLAGTAGRRWPLL